MKRGPKRRTAEQRRAQSLGATTTGTVTMTAPAYLTGLARAEFDRLVHELDQAGKLVACDVTLIVMAAEVWDDIRAYRKAIKKDGRNFKLPGGYRQANPDVKAMTIAIGKYSALLVKLGMTALERQRLGMHAGGPEKPAAEKTDERPGLRITKAG